MTRSLTASKDITFAKGYDMLKREGAENPKPRPHVDRTVSPVMLPRGSIGVANSVFQPRLGHGAMAESRAHVAVLAEAIRRSPSHLLDPILVWWSGTKWRVVDGHHRLMAYNQVSDTQQQNAAKRCIPIDLVPVEIFDGTLDEAILESASRNSRDKLRMTKRDKLERAWKLTASGERTIPQIATATGVSQRTVGTMRKTIEDLKKIDDGGFAGPGVEALAVSWEQAKKLATGSREIDDTWIEKQAQDWADRLIKTFGHKLAQNPETTLKALELYSERLPERMAQLWTADAGRKIVDKDGEED